MAAIALRTNVVVPRSTDFLQSYDVCPELMPEELVQLLKPSLGGEGIRVSLNQG